MWQEINCLEDIWVTFLAQLQILLIFRWRKHHEVIRSEVDVLVSLHFRVHRGRSSIRGNLSAHGRTLYASISSFFLAKLQKYLVVSTRSGNLCRPFRSMDEPASFQLWDGLGLLYFDVRNCRHSQLLPASEKVTL